jgi:hypothetical protein
LDSNSSFKAEQRVAEWDSFKASLKGLVDSVLTQTNFVPAKTLERRNKRTETGKQKLWNNKVISKKRNE